MITAQMFRKIKNPSKNFLIHGQPGIGKSYGLVLYRSLSEIIFRYKENCCSETDNKPQQIDFDIQKLVYLSLDLKNQTTYNEKQINTTILSQCLTKSELSKLDFKGGLKKELIEFFNVYQNQVNAVIVVDQINSYVNLKIQIDELEKKMSQIKSEMKKLGDSQADQIEKQNLRTEKINFHSQKNLLRSMFKKYKNLIQILRSSFGEKNGGKLIFLGSSDIQFQVVDKLNLNGSGTHTLIQRVKVEYENYLQNPAMISDNIELIRTLLERTVIKFKRFLPKNENSDTLTPEEDQQLDQVRKLVQKEFQQNYFTVTSLSIGDTFRQIEADKLNNFYQPKFKNLLCTEKNLVRVVMKLFGCQNEKILVSKLVRQINKNILKNDIQKFLLKDKKPKIIKEKKLFLFKLLYAAKEQWIKRQQNPSQESGSPFVFKFNKNETRTVYEFNKIFTRKLFQCTIENQYVLTVDIQILLSVLDSLQANLLIGLKDQLKKVYQSIDSPLQKEQLFESNIKHILSVKYTTFSYQSEFQSNPLKFELSNQKRIFNPIPKISQENYLEYDFLESFYDVMTAKQSNLSQSVSTHYYFETSKYNTYDKGRKSTSKIDYYSRSVDFVICQKQHQGITLFAYDITGRKTKQQVIKKVIKFLFNYANFTDNAFRDWDGPQVPYQPKIFYGVIVPTDQNIQINWIQTFKNEIKKLQKLLEDQEASKKLLEDHQQTEIKQIEKKMKIIQKAIQTISKLKITQKENSNSFAVHEDQKKTTGRRVRSKKSTKESSSEKQSKIILKGIEIISYYQKLNFLTQINKKFTASKN